MSIGLKNLDLKNWKSLVDWKLLVLLLFFLNVKLAIKIPAIAFVYLLQPNFKFSFSFKNSRLPLFYLLIIGVALLAFFINKSYQLPNYWLVLFTGAGFWLLCILAMHQVKLSIDHRSLSVINRTLVIFFIINAIFSALNLLWIVSEIGAINPYRYQGLHQKYFLSTGDYVKGATFDTSTTNAILNAIGVIYFLAKKQYAMLLLCMTVLIFTASNFSNLVLLFILGGIFVFKSTRAQKSMITVCIFLLVVFMAKVSPQNNKYMDETFVRIFKKDWKTNLDKPTTKQISLLEKPDSILTQTERKEKFATLYLDSLKKAKLLIRAVKVVKAEDTLTKNPTGRILLPQDNIHSQAFQSIKIPLKAQEPMLIFIAQHRDSLPYSSKRVSIPALPGKAVGFLQTAAFFKDHPTKIIAGNGMGNFSSKLAFRTSGLGITGNFPKKYSYINADFLLNHLDVYLYFFSKQTGFHSLTNAPFSSYDQLLAEYGLIGISLFFIFYIGYFLKHYRQLTYGIPILLLMYLILLIDYWFEQLSVIILFELVLLLNIKETSLLTLGGKTNE